MSVIKIIIFAFFFISVLSSSCLGSTIEPLFSLDYPSDTHSNPKGYANQFRTEKSTVKPKSKASEEDVSSSAKKVCVDDECSIKTLDIQMDHGASVTDSVSELDLIVTKLDELYDEEYQDEDMTEDEYYEWMSNAKDKKQS